MGESKHWWETVPAILGGVAAIIVAIGGIIAASQKETTPPPPVIAAPVVVPPSKCEAHFFSARNYSNARNIGVGTLSYGEVITNGGDGSKSQENMVEFSFSSGGVCNYRLDVEYAAAEARPVVITFNGTTINRDGLSERTGGWGLDSQEVLPQGSLASVTGVNTLRLYRDNVFPHIKSIRLVSTP